MMVLDVGECDYISYFTGMSIYVDLMDITLFYIFVLSLQAYGF